MDYKLTTKPWNLPLSNMYGIGIYNIATMNFKLLLHIVVIYSSLLGYILVCCSEQHCQFVVEMME